MRFILPVACLVLAACADRPPTEPEAPSLIINGQPTGAAYGAVGAVLYDFDRNGTVEGSEQLCTGTLIAPTLFLTAAHCLASFPATAALYVTFAPELFAGPLNLVAAARFTVDPAYRHDSANPHDLAVIELADPVTGIVPMALPPAGYLDGLADRGGLRGRNFVNVGYGLSASLTGKPTFGWDGARKMSRSPFQSLRPNVLSLLMATRATQLGGDCYGDSGGPKFLEGNSEMIVAVLSWGDRPCRAISVNYRLDTPSARAFLGRFVTLP
jgi:secreted trypsin-like serine protease